MSDPIRRLRELMERATPGRWMSAHIHDCWVRSDTGDPNGFAIVARMNGDEKYSAADSDLIAALRNLAPQLVEVCEAAREAARYTGTTAAGTGDATRAFKRLDKALAGLGGEG